MLKVIQTKRGIKIQKGDNIFPIKENKVLPVMDGLLELFQNKYKDVNTNVKYIDKFIALINEEERYIIKFLDVMFVINEDELLDLYEQVVQMYEKVLKDEQNKGGVNGI